MNFAYRFFILTRLAVVLVTQNATTPTQKDAANI
jgi:hypothetical protein